MSNPKIDLLKRDHREALENGNTDLAASISAQIEEAMAAENDD